MGVRGQKLSVCLSDHPNTGTGKKAAGHGGHVGRDAGNSTVTGIGYFELRKSTQISFMQAVSQSITFSSTQYAAFTLQC